MSNPSGASSFRLFDPSLTSTVEQSLDTARNVVGDQISKFSTNARNAIDQVGKTVQTNVERLQPVTTFGSRAANTIATQLVEPIQDTVKRVQTTFIVAIVLVIVLVAGVGVGMFFAGRASVQHRVSDARTVQQPFNNPFTPLSLDNTTT